MHRFRSYELDDLNKAGKAFAKSAKDCQPGLSALKDQGCGTEYWTEFVLDWFSACAAKDVCVDARPRRYSALWSKLGIKKGPKERTTYGEFMLDLTHTTYPAYSKSPNYYTAEYYRRAIENRCSILLALECEWGKSNSASGTFHDVMEDAAKLAAVNASAKVMVFGSVDQDNRREILAALETLREQARDESPWLCIDLPDWTDGKWLPLTATFPASRA